jgi:plasmid stabilization system protein ParE
MEVRFHRLAAQEYREARAWYEHRRSGLGDSFITEIDRAVAWVANQPERWPVFRDRFRRVRLRRFPYALYYRVVDPTQVIVLAVAHNRRRPGYWLRRDPR